MNIRMMCTALFVSALLGSGQILGSVLEPTRTESPDEKPIASMFSFELPKERMVIMMSRVAGLDANGEPARQMAVLPANVQLPEGSDGYLTYADLVLAIMSDSKPESDKAMRVLSDIYVKNVAEGGTNFWPISLISLLNCRKHKAERMLIRQDESNGEFYITDMLNQIPLTLFFVGIVSDETMKVLKSLTTTVQELPQQSSAFAFFEFSMGVDEDFTPQLVGKMTSEFATGYAEERKASFLSGLRKSSALVGKEPHKFGEFLTRLKSYTEKKEIVPFSAGETLTGIEFLSSYLPYLTSKYKDMLDYRRNQLITEIQKSFVVVKWVVKDSTFEQVKREIAGYFMSSSVSNPALPQQSSSADTDSTSSADLQQVPSLVPSSSQVPQNLDYVQEIQNLEILWSFIKFWTPEELNEALKYEQSHKMEEHLAISAVSLFDKNLVNDLLGFIHFSKYSLN